MPVVVGTGENPKRIQLSRKKGYRKPEGAVVVSRPGKWGNPYRWQECPPDIGSPERARTEVVKRYREMVMSPIRAGFRDEIRRELAGKDLACWCPLYGKDGARVPCHADVLLEIANDRRCL